jgi:hypothetical protein
MHLVYMLWHSALLTWVTCSPCDNMSLNARPREITENTVFLWISKLYIDPRKVPYLWQFVPVYCGLINGLQATIKWGKAEPFILMWREQKMEWNEKRMECNFTVVQLCLSQCIFTIIRVSWGRNVFPETLLFITN